MRIVLAAIALLALPSAFVHAENIKSEHRMPWDSEVAPIAGYAVVGLQNLLLKSLQDQQGVHVETLMTAVGALAGFSAQYAIRETIVKTGKMPEHGGSDATAGAFVVAGTKTGETFYFGDLLNSFLVPQKHRFGPGRHTLFGFTAAAVQEAGKTPLGHAELSEIFRRTASSVGNKDFGVPRLPEAHMPRLLPRQALDTFWPAAKLILSRTDAPGRKGQMLSPSYWPVVIATVAQKLINQSKGALDPAMSMRIVLEAAIPMSKVDYRKVPQELRSTRP